MKKLQVPAIASNSRPVSPDSLSEVLDQLEKHPIAEMPWPAYAYRPDVSFSLAHFDEGIGLKYYVREQAVRAHYRQANDPVYRDSCVEFFLCFGDEKEYYNFEFNCLGTCLLGFGSGRAQRLPLQESVIAQIKRQATLISRSPTDGAAPSFDWQLTLLIPVDVFSRHSIDSLSGMKARANFYKCGDDLPQPHYLAWNNIDTPQPDFHQPDFFGEVQFL